MNKIQIKKLQTLFIKAMEEELALSKPISAVRRIKKVQQFSDDPIIIGKERKPLGIPPKVSPENRIKRLSRPVSGNSLRKKKTK